MNISGLLQRYPAVDRLARRIYSAAPARIRLGKEFFHWYALHQEAESWSYGEIDEFKSALFRELIADAVTHIPYYREMFSTAALPNLADIGSAFPVMSREEFRVSLPRLRRERPLPGEFSTSTSGTTGSALQFKNTLQDNRREWASICHQWRRVGFDPLRSIRAEFRGLVAGGGIFEPHPESNMVRCSILHLRPEHVRHYADACRRNGVSFLHGYPSAIYLVARQVTDGGIRFPGIRGVMLSSEMVLPHQLAAIEAAFPEARIIAHYGSAERVGLAAWCERSSAYHFLPLYSHVEVSAEDGVLIGTNLFNRSNPFIRYRMTDLMQGVSWAKCDSCGRAGFPLVAEIVGREEDYLYSPVTGWIPPAIVTYPLKSLAALQEIQFFQEYPNQVEFRFSVRDGHQQYEQEVADVCADLQALLPGVKVVSCRFDDFPKSGAGKFKWIDSPFARQRPPC